jgi:outer membrane protein TolC
VLREQRSATSARELPRVSAFGRAGYGRPGLNPLASKFDTYWLAGVQFEWTPWSWGSTKREREVLSLQQQIVESEEAAFTASVRRSIVRDMAMVDRMILALEEDDAIVALREEVMREARIRFGEGVITSAEYVDRQTDALAARLARSSHRIELEQARARFLTSLGLGVR